jgi:hypothetical protein
MVTLGINNSIMFLCFIMQKLVSQFFSGSINTLVSPPSVPTLWIPAPCSMYKPSLVIAHGSVFNSFLDMFFPVPAMEKIYSNS